MLKQGQGKVKTRPKQGQGKDKVRSRQCKHNLNRNYNLMGFDTIEINLVFSFNIRVTLYIKIETKNNEMHRLE